MNFDKIKTTGRIIAAALLWSGGVISVNAYDIPAETPDSAIIIKATDFTTYLNGARTGDSEAQRRVAICYLYGTGTPRDTKEGIKWLGKAVNQRNTEAQYDLAVVYRDGIGIKQDYNEAHYWFEMAGRHDHPLALLNLGIMAEEGIGMLQDDRIALEQYWRAADRGNREAAYRLACMLRDGRGKPKDLVNAKKWFVAAGDYKDAPSQAKAITLPSKSPSAKKR